MQINGWALKLISRARIGHMATSTKTGKPHVIPFCFTYDGQYIFSPIDEKPKKTKPTKLRRMLNISKNRNVCLVVDRYDEDWRKLAYVIVYGRAEILLHGKEHQHATLLLKKKYRQYGVMSLENRPVIKITPIRAVAWKYVSSRRQ